MARPKSKGAYVPLAAHYFMDDAILEAGPDAELLFVRCLSFLASVPSDGFITERQVRTIVGLGLRGVPKRLEKLLDVGLLEAVDGGFVARSWQKWNKSTEEVGKLLARDRDRKSKQKLGDNSQNLDKNSRDLGNISRDLNANEIQDRAADSGDPSDDAGEGANSAWNPDGIHADSTVQSRAEQNRADNSPKGESPSDADGADAAEYTDEVKGLCTMLAERVQANGHKVGVVGVTWWQACERLMRLDGYTVEQIGWLIDWTTRDEFWAANIRSMPKFREKFSTLKAQAQAHPHGRGGSSGKQKQTEILALVAKFEEEEAHDEVGDGEGAGRDLGDRWPRDQRAVGGGVAQAAG